MEIPQLQRHVSMLKAALMTTLVALHQTSGSGDSNGNSIGLKNNQKQTALCQSAGGNSPITASCINAQAAGQTNSGGIATS